MIADVMQIKAMEANTAMSTLELIDEVAKGLFNAIVSRIALSAKILIVCGKGNNGADGLALAALLAQNNYDVKVYLVTNQKGSNENAYLLNNLDQKLITTKIDDASYDVIIDCIFGFSFHGHIRNSEKALFDQLNNLPAFKISVDINSGCEADDPAIDIHAFKSDLTLALGCYKPFHMFKKEHQMFKELALIPLPLDTSNAHFYQTMDKKQFLHHYPKIKVNDHKGCNGKALIVSGSYGMAGAAILNAIGALCCGMTYLHLACEDTIYPILANRFSNVVFHPFDRNTYKTSIENIMHDVDAIAFGSGMDRLPYRNDILELLLQYSYKTVVLDAQALRLLIDKLFVLKLSKPQLIITPHIKEFADLINRPIEQVKAHKISLAKEFAKDYHTIVVLKDTNTIIVSPNGEVYINTNGNQALARAGSGDLLTGFIVAMCALVKDNYLACIMAVWFYNHLCEQITQNTSITCFNLENYLSYADKFFKDENM
ncbi:MAG: NAD(P)H-hydrate dehydratase [Erysipelotrichaceae bacterium]|nr:NAD(P)H-hydrate dehydratase [Erysipelotrichaceae bacterium]MDY5252620.1 NAD(P)H-hydrate dehydratase [Erysipelotrichaceae bacterium]